MKKAIFAAMLIAGSCSIAAAQGAGGGAGAGGAGAEPARRSDANSPGALRDQPQAMRRGDDMAPLKSAPVAATNDPGLPTGERTRGKTSKMKSHKMQAKTQKMQ